MGSYVNGRAFNIIAWTTVMFVVLLTVYMSLDMALAGRISNLLTF